jgi:hypothetical protein
MGRVQGGYKRRTICDCFGERIDEMATHIFPSSYRCDCGHQLNFFENTVNEMAKMSLKKTRRIGEGHDPHTVEFRRGKATAVICPQLGPCTIDKLEM